MFKFKFRDHNELVGSFDYGGENEPRISVKQDYVTHLKKARQMIRTLRQMRGVYSVHVRDSILIYLDSLSTYEMHMLLRECDTEYWQCTITPTIDGEMVAEVWYDWLTAIEEENI